MPGELEEHRDDKVSSYEIDNIVAYLGYAVPDLAARDVTAYFLLELCISLLRERADCGAHKSSRTLTIKH
jgi:hypothetical protein